MLGDRKSPPTSPRLSDIDVALSDDDPSGPSKLLWTCIQRDGVILCEASDTNFISLQAVSQTAKELLARKATPGFEFHTQSRGFRIGSNKERRLKGTKFHVYEHVSLGSEEGSSFSAAVAPDDHSDAAWSDPSTQDRPDLRLWVFSAVYDPDVCMRPEVESFLEKMVTLTQEFRDNDPTWANAKTLELQPTFAPILKQRMQQVSYIHEFMELKGQIQACQDQMDKNITAILERGEDLDALADDATRMQEIAGVFKKRAKEVKRVQMMKNAKHGVVLGTAVSAGLAVIAIPPLVAIL